MLPAMTREEAVADKLLEILQSLQQRIMHGRVVSVLGAENASAIRLECPDENLKIICKVDPISGSFTIGVSQA